MAWGLVSGLVLVEPTPKAFRVPRRRTLSELRPVGPLIWDHTKP